MQSKKRTNRREDQKIRVSDASQMVRDPPESTRLSDRSVGSVGPSLFAGQSVGSGRSVIRSGRIDRVESGRSGQVVRVRSVGRSVGR